MAFRVQIRVCSNCVSGTKNPKIPSLTSMTITDRARLRRPRVRPSVAARLITMVGEPDATRAGAGNVSETNLSVSCRSVEMIEESQSRCDVGFRNVSFWKGAQPVGTGNVARKHSPATRETRVNSMWEAAQLGLTGRELPCMPKTCWGQTNQNSPGRF